MSVYVLTAYNAKAPTEDLKYYLRLKSASKKLITLILETNKDLEEYIVTISGNWEFESSPHT